ncbi:glycosyltransferase family 4 protein [Gaetbulibacter jejuensis]|uniref:glycosyltransferase family 4 protein n=1 Tax=Gaetbulibacter jejuensis TaxID=584607 RepID=UPI0030086F49
MNVLHLSSNIKFGGSEQQLIYLIEGLKKQNIKSFIFCYDTSMLLEYKEKFNAGFTTLPKQKAYSRDMISALKQVVKNESIDIIHIHNGKFVLTYMLADILFRLPCKVVFSKKDMATRSSLFSRIKYNYKGVQKVLCVSHAVKRRFEEILLKKNHYKLQVLRDGLNFDDLKIYDDVNIHKSFDIEPHKIIVGNVANHVNAKDLSTFVLTLDYLVNNCKLTNIHFLQIGRFTGTTETLKELVKEKQLDDYITFTDFIKDGYKYTSQCDIFLMTSINEGLPLTIMESFYYKIPVVSTIAGGIPEAITHGENGLLADLKDAETLGKHIISLCNDDVLKKNIIENAYTLVTTTFSAQKMTENTIVVYNELLGK